jgi:hypothetical protein
MIVLFVVVAVTLVAVGIWEYLHRRPPVFDDTMRRAVVGLYTIRTRDNLREYKREVRRNADDLRRELDRELGSK